MKVDHLLFSLALVLSGAYGRLTASDSRNRRQETPAVAERADVEAQDLGDFIDIVIGVDVIGGEARDRIQDALRKILDRFKGYPIFFDVVIPQLGAASMQVPMSVSQSYRDARMRLAMNRMTYSVM